MNNKRKNRPGPARPRRGLPVPAPGIYNNLFFMHAATSYVGNLVQLQTHSGSIYEGLFKTFSPNFDVALELAQCIKNNPTQNSDDNKISLPNCMIFQPNQIVSIVAKDVDLDYATSGSFQTDSAISSRCCNGCSPLGEKELEPWDPSGGNINGEIDINLELDGNANGWDVNEMFNKNEKLYGVQSTFDHSLAGYTVQIEKKDTQDYKDAEAEAEKIAQEIENQPNYRERIDVENGDEESRFAAVERPLDQQSPESLPPPAVNTTNPNTMSKATNSVEKYVLPPKRKNVQTNKLVRSTPPPNNNNGHLSQQNSHSNSKNNNYQTIQIQQGPPQYMLNQNFPHMHGHPTNMSQSKINGEGNSSNSNNKPLPQRSIRQYPSQPSTTVSYSESQSLSGQMSLGKPPMHVSQSHSHVSAQHTTNSMQDGQQTQQSSHVVMSAHHVVIPGGAMVAPPPQAQPPPQPQRQPRAREDQIKDLRKFQTDFNLGNSNQQQQQPQQQQQQTINQVKTPSVSPHQPPQPSLSPPQSQQQQQTLSPMPPQSHQQQQHQHSQLQNDNSPPIPTQKISQHVQAHMQQQQEQQPTYTTNQPPPPQPLPPPTIISPPTTGIVVSSSTTPPQQLIVNNNSNNSISESATSEKLNTSGVVKKTHVLNPAAKPFTPRSPSTPNPSRPHTPQTPGPAMTPGVYTQGPHVTASQGPMVTTYVMQPPQQTYQTPPHAQQRMRRIPVATSQQMQAAAATGQPLLTAAAPLQPFMHYQQAPHPQHFQSQPYPHMVRVFPDPPPHQPIQFLAQTPPSTTPSPGQPHQQFHPGPQPSPAGGGPQAYGPAPPQPPHFPVMCPVLGHPQLVPPFYQGAGQTPHHAQPFQVMMQQHPSQ